MERREDARDNKPRRHRVGPRTKRSRRLAIRPSDLIRRARHRRAHRADSAGALRIRTRLSEQAGRRHDDPLIALTQIRVAEMKGLQHAGRETLQHDVRPIHQPQNNFPPLGPADIDRDASFARVEVVIADRAFGARLPILEWPERAHRIDAF